MSEDVITPAPKVDPETFAIRSKPARAIRFRRGVIIAIAALGSVSLMAVAWIALKPRVFSAVADRQELSEPSKVSAPRSCSCHPTAPTSSRSDRRFPS